MDYNSVRSQTIFSTVRIDVPILDKYEMEVSRRTGTGVLISTPNAPNSSGDKGNYIFLVTNRHILKDEDMAIIHFLQKRRGTDEPLLGGYMVEEIDHLQDKAFHHINPHIDLSVLDVTGIIAEKIQDIFYKSVSIQDCSDYSEQLLDVGLDIQFIGYPMGIYDTENKLPIIRKALISSHPKLDFQGKPHVLIDGQVFPGSSGSPVYIYYSAILQEHRFLGNDIGKKAHPQMKLIGILSEFFYTERGEIVEDLSDNDVEVRVALGIIQKSTEVRKMLRRIAAEKFINDNCNLLGNVSMGAINVEGVRGELEEKKEEIENSFF